MLTSFAGDTEQAAADTGKYFKYLIARISKRASDEAADPSDVSRQANSSERQATTPGAHTDHTQRRAKDTSALNPAHLEDSLSRRRHVPLSFRQSYVYEMSHTRF